MDKIFAEMFAKQPDEIINGDYFYALPWHDENTVKSLELIGSSVEEYHTKRENAIKMNFKPNWEVTSYQSRHDLLQLSLKNIEAKEIISKIALENKPFMDIASSDSMGLSAYIVKMNPKIPCLVTDMALPKGVYKI